jgi:glycine cleavage system aminomethyltransferase T
MGERSGWEIPLYFDRPGASLPHVPSLGWQEWFPLIERESHAARDAAVLFDHCQHACGGYRVNGSSSAASKLSSTPTPEGSLQATCVSFETGTLLIV